MVDRRGKQWRRDHPWWAEPKGESHRATVETFKLIDDEQHHHRARNLHHARLYSARMAAQFSGKSYSAFLPWETDELTYNVVQAVIDAAVAQIGSQRSRPFPSTIEGDHKLKKKAELLGRYYDGQFHALKMYDKGLTTFQHGAVFGTGVQKIFASPDGVKVEKRLIDNIVVDDYEATIGEPRNYFEYAEVPREVLAHAYGEDHPALKKAGPIRRDNFHRESIVDPVGVINAWHIPSGKDAKDGRAVLVTEMGTLDDDTWERMYPPFLFWRWKEPLMGFYGIGISEELQSIQQELNYLLEKMQRILWHAVPETWLQEGGSSASNFTNEEFAIRWYKGAPPVFRQAASVAPEMFSQIDKLVQRAFELTGVSMLFAAGQKPAGLNSGKAMRIYSDMQSSRFKHVGQRWDEYYMHGAQLLTDAAEDCQKIYGVKTRVLAPTRAGIEEIDFGQINLSRDRYIMRVYPTNYLPSHPAGKVEAIQEFAQVSPEIQKGLLRHLEHPDLESAVGLATAPIEIAEMAVGQILDGEYVTPEPYWDLQLCRDHAAKTLMRSQIDRAPEENLDMLRQFIDECEEQLKMAAAPPQAPVMPGAPAAPVPPVA